MQIFIQIIETRWSKLSRGNPGATLRNQVPEIYRFPDSGASEKTVFQIVSYSERTSFAKADADPVLPLSAHDSKKWRIAVEPGDAFAKILFDGVPNSPSSGRPVNVSELPPHSWMRIVGNRRVAEEYSWTYRKYVYNVFHGDVFRANELVAQKPPLFSFNFEEHLW